VGVLMLDGLGLFEAAARMAAAVQIVGAEDLEAMIRRVRALATRDLPPAC
jgi:hypothetical protein